MSRTRLLALAPLVATLLTVAADTPAARGVHPAASGRPFSGVATYREANPGKSQGQATLGVSGRGVFSAKLTPGARLLARWLGRLEGVPLESLARGGTYVARFDIGSGGTYRGLIVARFRAPGLGSVCVAGSIAHGAFRPGIDRFIPAGGSFATIGGTGLGARLRLSGSFKQNDVKGEDVEQFLESGAFRAVLGPAKAPSAVCLAVARLATP